MKRQQERYRLNTAHILFSEMFSISTLYVSVDNQIRKKDHFIWTISKFVVGQYSWAGNKKGK